MFICWRVKGGKETGDDRIWKRAMEGNKMKWSKWQDRIGRGAGKERRRGNITVIKKQQQKKEKWTYLDSQRLGTLPAGALNLELHLQDIHFFEEMTGDWKEFISSERPKGYIWIDLPSPLTSPISYLCPRTRKVMQPIWLSLWISALWGLPNASSSQWKWINDSHLPPVPTASDWLHPSASAGSRTKHQTSTGGKKELNQRQIDVFDFHHNLFCYHSSEAPDWMCPC